MEILFLIERIQQQMTLPEALRQELALALKKRKVNAGWQNAFPTRSIGYILWILEGDARVYSITDDGHDYTRFFGRPNALLYLGAREYAAASNRRDCLEALTELSFVYLEPQALERMLKTYPAMALFLSRVMSETDMLTRERNSRRQRREPEETYEHFLRTHGDLEEMVPAVHIASYLGISPGELHRARQKWRDRSIM